MTLATLAAKNLLRNRFRTVLTILGISMSIVAFVFLRTIVDAWTVGIEYAAKDRIATRHKITYVMSLPRPYAEKIQNWPGVAQATWCNWFGGKDPNHESEFFATIAVDPESFLEVYDEILVPDDQRARWLETRHGALVGDALAKKLGWKVGDRITIQGSIYAGDWEFEVSGIYTAERRSVDRSTFWFHWNYLNDDPRVVPSAKDQVGWIVARIDDPSQAARISKDLDDHFAEEDVQTLTMSERAMGMSFLGMISAILMAVDVVSVVILLIMMLIVGNTIAMSVRERTHEFGALRAIGFLPGHIAFFVVGEAVTIATAGGLFGLALAYPFVEQGVGRFLEENVGGMFPYFRIEPGTAALAFGLSLALAAVAALLPARGASRLDVVQALRRVG